MLAEESPTQRRRGSLEGSQCDRIVEVLKALAHPLRLQIVTLLCDSEEHVSRIAQDLQTDSAIVSQQLRILRMTGLVETTRCGGFAVYRLADPDQRQLIRCLKDCRLSH